MEKIWKDRRMTALVDISAENVFAIREGLNDLGNALLSINKIAGDDSSSRLVIDGGGILKVQGLQDTVFEGNVGIGVSAVTNGISLETSGPVKFQNKKMEVGDGVPTIGLYNQGDIVWHDAPSPGGNLGWICVRTGTPGEWRSFGTISG
tara:strand:- start:2120 stop:2566 length:447 start_codon:yes stop_codon:yes gene_type:complete